MFHYEASVQHITTKDVAVLNIKATSPDDACANAVAEAIKREHGLDEHELRVTRLQKTSGEADGGFAAA